jgi:septal ring factor EnvC (AmiA/AmiB activator)
MPEDQEEPLLLCRPPSCAQSHLIESHGHAIDSAHQKLREHETKIEQLRLQYNGQEKRLTDVEKVSGDNMRLLIRIDGRLDKVEQGVMRVESTTAADHKLLVQHVNDGVLESERIHKRLVRIVSLVGAAVILLMLIHSSRGDGAGLLSSLGSLGILP